MEDLKSALELNLVGYTESFDKLHFKASELFDGLQQMKYNFITIKENKTMYMVEVEGEDFSIVFNKAYSKSLNPEYIIYDLYVQMLNLEIKRVTAIRDKIER